MDDTGETVKKINNRGDNAAWPNILAGLKDGGRLKLHYKIRRAVLESIPENHPSQRGLKTISISLARRLERRGVIVQSGIDQYMLGENQ